jgi:hypothetical protein
MAFYQTHCCNPNIMFVVMIKSAYRPYNLFAKVYQHLH